MWMGDDEISLIYRRIEYENSEACAGSCWCEELRQGSEIFLQKEGLRNHGVSKHARLG